MTNSDYGRTSPFVIREGEAIMPITKHEIEMFKRSHPPGSTVLVLIRTIEKKRVVDRWRTAMIIKCYPRVVETTRGTFQWAELVICNR